MAMEIDFVEELRQRNIPVRQYTDWHYLIDNRFDYWPTKDKWFDRLGHYGTNVGLDELMTIVVSGAFVPKEKAFPPRLPPRTTDSFIEEETETILLKSRSLNEIVYDLENLLEELKEHL